MFTNLYEYTLNYPLTSPYGRQMNFNFKYKFVDSSCWRAYILNSPSYGSRSSSLHHTHRLYDSSCRLYYICWTARLTKLDDITEVSKMWARATANYVDTGSFDPNMATRPSFLHRVKVTAVLAGIFIALLFLSGNITVENTATIQHRQTQNRQQAQSKLGIIFRNAGFNWSNREKLIYVTQSPNGKYYLIDFKKTPNGEITAFFSGFLTQAGRKAYLKKYGKRNDVNLNIFAYHYSKDGSMFERVHDGYYVASQAGYITQEDRLVFNDRSRRRQKTQSSEIARIGYRIAKSLL